MEPSAHDDADAYVAIKRRRLEQERLLSEAREKRPVRLPRSLWWGLMPALALLRYLTA